MNALELIASRLKEKEVQLMEFLATGGATDYAHYQSVVGEIKGVLYAYNETRDTNDRLTKENDD